MKTMKKTIGFLTLITLLSISCSRVKEKAKDGINKGGEVVGKTAAEFIEGVSEGVDKTLDLKIELSKDLLDNGISTGTFSTSHDKNKSVLTLYLIFEKDFDLTISAKAFDKSQLEIGRTKLEVKGKAGEAGYYHFEFDEETNFESKCTVTIE